MVEHLKEDIVGDAELLRRSFEIWREHGEALQLLQKNRPGLETEGFYERFLKAVKEQLPTSVALDAARARDTSPGQ
jgi:hypothetical protein